MKILVISDTHGNINHIRHVVGFAKSQSMSAIFHCGDFSTSQDVVEVLKSGLPLYAVTGNADEARYNEIWSALEPATLRGDVLKFTVDGRKIAMGHEPSKVREFIQNGSTDAVFYGHLHSPSVKLVGDTLVVNPGALGNTTKPSFAIYDTESNTAEIIEIPF
ncbi:MAG: YfcE family phosphodiesterase [Patescibacteria group bacterium]